MAIKESFSPDAAKRFIKQRSHYERGGLVGHTRNAWCGVVIRSTTNLVHNSADISCHACRTNFEAYRASPEGIKATAKVAANRRAMEERMARHG